ncbi:MAG: type II toxin-antitoxin system RelE/ParE family toxin [Thermoanaerobaculia bacterium]
MEARPRRVEIYVRFDGKAPFTEWLDGLGDVKARAKIRVRIDRVSLGNVGDRSSVGEGVQELRVDFGPGYRVYFAEVGKVVVLLLCGGDKSGQQRDIRNAKQYWKDYRSR